MPKLLLQVSVQEIHKSLVSPPEEGGPKEAKYDDNNIIISDSTLRNILPPQLKKLPRDTKLFVVMSLHI